jgi:hypothetical protein
MYILCILISYNFVNGYERKAGLAQSIWALSLLAPLVFTNLINCEKLSYPWTSNAKVLKKRKSPFRFIRFILLIWKHDPNWTIFLLLSFFHICSTLGNKRLVIFRCHARRPSFYSINILLYEKPAYSPNIFMFVPSLKVFLMHSLFLRFNAFWRIIIAK